MNGLDVDFWRGRRVLLTGHTGFKGGWLSLWLQQLGAQVHGLALAPDTTPNLFTEARVAQGMASSTFGDIRDLATVRAAFEQARPEVLLHLAAQPLVRASYADPVGTYATNVMGTVHVLEAARQVPDLRAIVNVTTDKVYENREWLWGYREDEALGGHDPYSSSKGCAELVSSAYRRSFLAEQGVALATARAGNVLGGGDWAADRLVPDLLRAFDAGQPADIRNPAAVRPWQHVIEPLSGYLLLAQRLATEGTPWAEAWNFGPREADNRPVGWIVDRLSAHWHGQDHAAPTWQHDGGHHPHEAGLLKLDIAKVVSRLGWAPRWTLDQSLQCIAEWHRRWRAGDDARALCLAQIQAYQDTLPA
ncbi:MAG: CDP-glucose 4,6-dehydratase [Burkholderiales bacterium PBB5]|nr:MAG: CDP-glucose 4,6-dehydratase [Burkholderiales bacterium PBB5]